MYSSLSPRPFILLHGGAHTELSLASCPLQCCAGMAVQGRGAGQGALPVLAVFTLLLSPVLNRAVVLHPSQPQFQ